MLLKIKEGQTVSDSSFDKLFPVEVRKAAEFHFTPVEVAKLAAQFLVSKEGIKVLDIGSGAGKFCLIGAATTKGEFTGVEQRPELCIIARHLAQQYELTNTNFINDNLTNIDFSTFDAFYIFNPFMEHRTPNDVLDVNIDIDRQLYTVYSNHVKEALAKMPTGTRLATYFSYGDEIPVNYVLVGGDEEMKLRFWQKNNFELNEQGEMAAF